MKTPGLDGVFPLEALRVVFAMMWLAQTAQCVTVQSSEYSVWGDWAEQAWYEEGEPEQPLMTGVFGLTNSTPISFLVSTEPYHSSQANADIGPFTLSLRGYADFRYEGPSGVLYNNINFFGFSRTVFQANSDQLQIDVASTGYYNYRDGDAFIALRDLTEGVTLYKSGSLVPADADWEWNDHLNFLIDVASSHEFALDIWGDFRAYDGTDLRMDVSALVSEVPEPGVGGLLLACLVAFLGKERWCQKRRVSN